LAGRDVQILHEVNYMAYVNYNPNPQGLSVGDCVIRAVSKATGLSWE